jgi:hypothetical protein
MTSTSPSLLTLPRELRDHIYSYLTQELNFCVSYDAGQLPEVRQEKAFAIHIENAPLGSVLLSHSRLHDEYLETPFFKTIRATVHIDGTIGSHSERPLSQLPELTASQADSTLRRVLHAIIIIDFGDGNNNGRQPDFAAYWPFLQTFALKFGTPATPLLSLKIAASFRTYAMIMPYIADTRTDFYQNTIFRPPPIEIACLPLIQRLEAERFTIILAGGSVHHYNISLLCCYAFQDELEEERYWDKGLLAKHFPINGTGEPWDRDAEACNLPAWHTIPHRSGLWKERSGREEVLSAGDVDESRMGFNSWQVEARPGGEF